MTPSARRLASIPNRSVEDLLALGALGQGKLQVTLHLCSGQSLSGDLLKLETAAGRLMLASGGDTPRVSFVGTKSITAVTVGCTWEDLHLLGAAPAPLDESFVPTRLQLRRRLEKLQGELAQAGLNLALELPDQLVAGSEQARWVLQETLDSLQRVLVGLASEETGREALGSCSDLRIATGPTARVTRSGGQLQVCLLERNGLLEPFPPAPLREELERVL